MPLPQYDYIIVGTGSGGGHAAARLVNAGFSVLSLEAGGDFWDSATNTSENRAYNVQIGANDEMLWDWDYRVESEVTKYVGCWSGLVEVLALGPGAIITINGVALLPAGGPRTPGANDYDDALGSVNAIAASIWAAINDPLNGFAAAGAKARCAQASVIIDRVLPVVGNTTLASSAPAQTRVTVTNSPQGLTAAQCTIREADQSMGRMVGGSGNHFGYLCYRASLEDYDEDDYAMLKNCTVAADGQGDLRGAIDWSGGAAVVGAAGTIIVVATPTGAGGLIEIPALGLVGPAGLTGAAGPQAPGTNLFQQDGTVLANAASIAAAVNTAPSFILAGVTAVQVAGSGVVHLLFAGNVVLTTTIAPADLTVHLGTDFVNELSPGDYIQDKFGGAPYATVPMKVAVGGIIDASHLTLDADPTGKAFSATPFQASALPCGVKNTIHNRSRMLQAYRACENDIQFGATTIHGANPWPATELGYVGGNLLGTVANAGDNNAYNTAPPATSRLPQRVFQLAWSLSNSTATPVQLRVIDPAPGVAAGVISFGANLLTAAAARVSGANNFNNTLGTKTAIAADIAAAINDTANMFRALGISAVASGEGVLLLSGGFVVGTTVANTQIQVGIPPVPAFWPTTDRNGENNWGDPMTNIPGTPLASVIGVDAFQVHKIPCNEIGYDTSGAVGPNGPIGNPIGGGQQTGGTFHLNKYSERRSQLIVAIDPIRGNPKFTLSADSVVDKVLMEDSGSGLTAVGVSYYKRDSEGGAWSQVVAYGKNIVVSAGPFGTPAVLLRSGIGAIDRLAPHGIVQILDLPGVGANAVTHSFAGSGANITLPTAAGENNIITQGVSYACLYKSSYTQSPTRQAAYSVGAPAVCFDQGPDMRANLGAGVGSESAPIASNAYGLPTKQATRTFSRSVTVGPAFFKCRSRGDGVRLRSTWPFDPPEIRDGRLEDPNSFEAEAFVELGSVLCAKAYDAVGGGVCAANGIPGAAGSAIALPSVGLPGNPADWPARIASIHAQVTSALHCVSTCRMGPPSETLTGWLSVCDQYGRVYGVKNLACCDNSIYPTQTRANSHWPTVGAAETLTQEWIAKGGLDF